MTRFAIARHGVTDWNIEGRMQGHRDIPLNLKGLEQARKLAERLQREHWDVIVCSDLMRAAQTAACIADKAGIEIRIEDPRLRERSYGELEGTTQQDRIERWGEDWKQLNHGVEEDESLMARVSQSFEQLVNVYGNQKVIIVTHGGWIRQFYDSIFPNEFLVHPNNTSLSIVQWVNDDWNCSLYNCTAHLDVDQEKANYSK